MVSLDIGELLPAFPRYRVALVVAAGLKIVERRSPELAREAEELEAAVRRDYGGLALSEVPRLRAWREAYKRFGVKKTSYRSSVERLIRSLLGERGLPAVNSLVDSYNLVSAAHLMPVGADDLARLTGPLAFRYARPGDTFVRLGEEAVADPPRAGEVVYADAEKVLCRRWNWAQDARSAISPGTERAVLTVQCFDDGAALAAAATDLADRLSRHCGARARWAVASAASPLVTVDVPGGV